MFLDLDQLALDVFKRWLESIDYSIGWFLWFCWAAAAAASATWCIRVCRSTSTASTAWCVGACIWYRFAIWA